MTSYTFPAARRQLVRALLKKSRDELMHVAMTHGARWRDGASRMAIAWAIARALLPEEGEGDRCAK